MICEEGKEIGHVKRYPSQGSIFFYSPTALLPFAISLIIHGLLLLRSSQKKYYSISGCSLQHLYFVISPWTSCPSVFFHTPFFFSSICDEGLMPSNQLHFFWKKEKNLSKLMLYFIDKSIPPYSVQNLRSISAQCGRICQLMKCQSSIMEK